MTKYAIENPQGERIATVSSIKAAHKAVEAYFQGGIQQSLKQTQEMMRILGSAHLALRMDNSIRCYIKCL